MSRATKLIFITFVSLALLFSAYLLLAPQPSITHRTSTLTPATRRSTTSPTGSLGQGEGAWVKQFDVNTGRISSQFRGQVYERQPDNTVLVTKPEAEFYLSDGQILHIEGETGIVTVQESLRPGRDQYFSGPSKPPTRGDMKTVRIRLLKDAAATEPTLTVVMDNATFDNETFRIFTQPAIIDGQELPADQIPVSLRGDDYDFDGRGLTIRLNQRDRRLEYLEITHGHHLTIKNPSNLDDRIPNPQSARRFPHFENPLPEMYASTGTILPLLAQAPARRRSTPPAAPSTVPSPPAIYRATFQDNVRVTQANEDIATGTQLEIDFLFEDEDQSATRPSTRPEAAGGSEAPRLDIERSTLNVERSEPPQLPMPTLSTAATSPSDPASASTRPTQPPVTIFWTGKLTLHPVPVTDDAPTARNSIVRITGAPLNVRQGSSTISGSAMVYRTATQHLSLRGTDEHQLTLSDGKGATVHGTAIDYLQQERLATLDGPGSATKLLPPDAPSPSPNPQFKEMTTRWTRSATLFFSEGSTEPLRIETAQLAGAVSVDHPQLKLTADTLKLSFDPTPTTRPAPAPGPQSTPDLGTSELRHLDAAGSVKATVLSSNNRPQSISADRLLLDTASTSDGRIYPKTLTADGNVLAEDPDQQLRAGNLKATLLPVSLNSQSEIRNPKSSQPADSVPVELEHLAATDNVSIQTADGVTVSASRLDVDVDPDTRAQHVRLLGSPAHVSSKENSVTGPFIEILPDAETYHVRGPGKMHLLQRETAESKPRPVDISWKDAVTVDGKQNLITVLGSVAVLSTDESGTRNTATGEHLVITLADNPAPATRPATQKSTPLTGIASTGDPMQNKTVQTITFKQGAALESVQTNKVTQDLLRQMNVIADVVSYDLPSKRITIPVPGRMLLVNRAPADAKAADNPNLAGNRGTTAFAWSQQMVFDQLANIMTMTGDVIIAHESETADKPFRLDADKVTAILESTTPTTNKEQLSTNNLQLKHVTAEGTIRFTSKETQLTASTVDYDPATGVLIARGQGRDPVRLYDPEGVQLGAAREVHYNTKTGQNLKMIDVQAQTRRRL